MSNVLPLGSGADISLDGIYRYRLWRTWDNPEHRCLWMMLNPSTADADKDDPTIRKCIGFAKRWGFGAIDVVNLFAFRATDPTELLTAADPVGLENDGTTLDALRSARRVVLAWGQHDARVRKLVAERAKQFVWRARDAGTLGRSQSGSPRHPLMLAYTTEFQPL